MALTWTQVKKADGDGAFTTDHVITVEGISYKKCSSKKHTQGKHGPWVKIERFVRVPDNDSGYASSCSGCWVVTQAEIDEWVRTGQYVTGKFGTKKKNCATCQKFFPCTTSNFAADMRTRTHFAGDCLRCDDALANRGAPEVQPPATTAQPTGQTTREVDGVTEKYCIKCEAWKTLDREHFYYSQRSTSGFHSYCITCMPPWRGSASPESTQVAVSHTDHELLTREPCAEIDGYNPDIHQLGGQLVRVTTQGMIKYCPCGKHWRAMSEFSVDPTMSTGHKSWCAACTREVSVARRALKAAGDTAVQAVALQPVPETPQFVPDGSVAVTARPVLKVLPVRTRRARKQNSITGLTGLRSLMSFLRTLAS